MSACEQTKIMMLATDTDHTVCHDVDVTSHISPFASQQQVLGAYAVS